MDLLHYIKNFFNSITEESRKRRAVDDIATFQSPKYRKIDAAMSRDRRTSLNIRRPSMNITPIVKDSVVIVDDDYVPPKKYTSTPTEPAIRASLFGNENKSLSEQRHLGAKLMPKLRSPLATTRTSLLRNSFKNTPSALQRNGNALSNGSSKKMSPMHGYTYQLKDKRDFQKMLDSHLSGDATTFFTPMSSLSKYDCSSKKMLSFSRNNQTKFHTPRSLCIDLTDDSIKVKNSAKKTTSTKNTILNILQSNDDKVVDLVDTDDSEVEILPNPPSPKPDIKVEPVNSLKKVVESNNVTSPHWLGLIVSDHKNKSKLSARNIEELQENTKSLNEINNDIRMGSLTSKIQKCLKIKDAVVPIIEIEEEEELPTLTEEHLRIVDKAFRGGSPNEVLVRKFNLSITRKDILTLAGLNWLNDEVINFYMNLLIQRSDSCSNNKYPKTYAFNTFFYPKLLRDGAPSLRRWTKKIDIFAQDIVCIPVHLGVHWCMSIIDFRDQSIRYYDSMGSTNNKCLEALRGWLHAEHLDKKKQEYDSSNFILENMADIPQQMNGSDCGMFSCTFAEFITRNAKITFKQEDMPYLRKKMVVEIVTGELLIT